MIKSGKPVVLKVTANQISKFRAISRFVGDRKLKPAIQKMLKEDVERGVVLPFIWATCTDESTGETYRVDGNNSSAFLYENFSSVKNTLYIVLTHYTCDTTKEVGELWGVFNAKESSRTSREIIKGIAVTDPDLDGISVDLLQTGAAAIDSSDFEDRATRGLNRGMRIVDDEWKGFIHFLDKLQKVSPEGFTKRARKMTVVEGILNTFMLSPGDTTYAFDFWRDVLGGRGELENSPRRRLAAFLGAAVTHSDSANSKVTVVKRPRMLFTIHKVWNADVAGKSTFPQNPSIGYKNGVKIPKLLNPAN